MHRARLFSFCAAAFALLSGSCGSQEGDPHSDHGVPPPEGKDLHIRQITDPASPQRAQHLQTVAVSGVTVIAVDKHDETLNGKSRGTIYVQDLGSQEPYSGISLFAPEFIPGNLRVGPGDVLDMRGTYQENQNIGSAVFAPGATLPQLARPVATFRYEGKPLEPKDIDIKDLENYETGRKWLNMLVRVSNVTIRGAVFESGNSQRVSVALTDAPSSGVKCEDPFPKAPTITNELANLNELNIKGATPVKSIVGVVTYFCNLHLSPRSPADVQIN